MRNIQIENYPTNIIIGIDNKCIDVNIDQWQLFTLEENVDSVIDGINNSLDIALNETETDIIVEKLNIIFGN